MKAPVKSNQKGASKRSASKEAENTTVSYAVGFLILWLAWASVDFLNTEQNRGENRSSALFSVAFLAQFISIFLLGGGRLGLSTIYFLLTQLSPSLAQPWVLGILFMLYYFLLESPAN